MPGPADVTRLHAHEQSALLRAGGLTSRELTEAHLASAERDNRALNAWLTVDRERALAEADAATPDLPPPAPRLPWTGRTRCSASRSA